MSDFFERFETQKRFIGFSEIDVGNLVALSPIFQRRGAAITDSFYEVLGHLSDTARFIEGRVEHLKQTHARWMMGLFAGSYGQEYVAERLRIGQAHVRVGLDPAWVEGVMSLLRVEGMVAICDEIADKHTAAAQVRSYLRILDLDLFVIGHAYAQERLERLSSFTGMNRRLIENVIRMAGKKGQASRGDP